MIMLDFICRGSTELLGTGREEKNKNENICLQLDSNPRPVLLDRQVNQSSRPLDHDGLTTVHGLMSYWIMGNKLIPNSMEEPMQIKSSMTIYL